MPQTDALPTELTPPYFGTLGGIRTPDPLLRRQLLYPTELQAHIFFGAGDGNRTHTTSLEGWDSAIELHPHLSSERIISNLYGFVKPFKKVVCAIGRVQTQNIVS